MERENNSEFLISAPDIRQPPDTIDWITARHPTLDYPDFIERTFKDIYFTDESVARIADLFTGVHPAFDGARFLELVHDGTWPDLELKARLRRVAESLGPVLPSVYGEALDVLRAADAIITEEVRRAGMERELWQSFGFRNREAEAHRRECSGDREHHRGRASRGGQCPR